MDVETGAGGIAKTDLGNIKEDIIAAVDDAYDLGSEDKKWAAIWVALAFVTSLVIGGAISLTNVDGVLFINASTEINGSLNISEDLFVNGTIVAGTLDIQNLSVENMNFTNLTITGDLFNISATETYVNALFPNEYCTSDLGSDALRWNDGYFCGNLTAGYFVGDGSFLTNLPAGNETDPYWLANYSIFLTHITWAEATNGTLAELSTILGFSYYNSTNPQTELDPYWTGNETNVAFKNEVNLFTANQNLTAVNISTMDCIIFDSGGTICSGV